MQDKDAVQKVIETLCKKYHMDPAIIEDGGTVMAHDEPMHHYTSVKFGSNLEGGFLEEMVKAFNKLWPRQYWRWGLYAAEYWRCPGIQMDIDYGFGCSRKEYKRIHASLIDDTEGDTQ